MATEVKVIKVRRGPYTDFDKTKMNAGEPAITTSGDPNALDGKGVYMGVGPGQVKQVAMIEDIEDILNNAADEAVDEATQQAKAEADRAEAAATQLASAVTQVATNKANISELNERIDNLNPGLTDDVKIALLACFRHVGFLDDNDDYYGALESALNESEKTIVSITAVFNQGQNIIYSDDELDILKQYLTVTASYSDGTSSEVLGYTLHGTLVAGTSTTITVLYSGKSSTFTVNVSSVVRIPVSQYFTETYLGGSIYSPVNNEYIYIKNQNGYNSYYVTVSTAQSLWFENLPANKYFAFGKISNVTNIVRNVDDITFYGTNPVRYRTSESSMPSVDNKLSVSTGDTIMITLPSSISPDNIKVYTNT